MTVSLQQLPPSPHVIYPPRSMILLYILTKFLASKLRISVTSTYTLLNSNSFSCSFWLSTHAVDGQPLDLLFCFCRMKVTSVHTGQERSDCQVKNRSKSNLSSSQVQCWIISKMELNQFMKGLYVVVACDKGLNSMTQKFPSRLIFMFSYEFLVSL